MIHVHELLLLSTHSTSKLHRSKMVRGTTELRAAWGYAGFWLLVKHPRALMPSATNKSTGAEKSCPQLNLPTKSLVSCSGCEYHVEENELDKVPWMSCAIFRHPNVLTTSKDSFKRVRTLSVESNACERRAARPRPCQLFRGTIPNS